MMCDGWKAIGGGVSLTTVGELLLQLFLGLAEFFEFPGVRAEEVAGLAADLLPAPQPLTALAMPEPMPEVTTQLAPAADPVTTSASWRPTPNCR